METKMKSTALAITIVLLTLSPALAGTAPAKHGSKSASLNVHATVATSCKFTTPAFSFSIGMASIHAPGSAIASQKSLNVQCTKGASTQISMDYGLNGSAAGSRFGNRSMSYGGTFLGYDLCHDSSCSSVWTPGGYNYVSPGDAGSTLPVWTVIKTGQNQINKLGTYTDSVTVTISF
jgi:spore coat protein U-like protein